MRVILRSQHIRECQIFNNLKKKKPKTTYYKLGGLRKFSNLLGSLSLGLYILVEITLQILRADTNVNASIVYRRFSGFGRFKCTYKNNGRSRKPQNARKPPNQRIEFYRPNSSPTAVRH